jgi:hypothetical protein
MQDVHNMPEAQLNAAKTLEVYQTKAGLNLVGLEGATGGFITEKFRAMKAPEALKWASDFVLNERMLSGAEYFGLNAPQSATLWGVEDEGTYLANVASYKATVALRPEVAAFEGAVESNLKALREKVYTPALMSLDRRRALYQEEKITLAEYVESLAAGPAAEAGVGMGSYPNLTRFRKAMALEKGIDFKRVEGERTAFLTALTGRLTKEELGRSPGSLQELPFSLL